MASDQKILDARGVTVSFDGFKVLDSLDFSMDYGELRFLIGPNGAGKTTLLDILTGKTRPESGRIVFDGHIHVRFWPEHELVQHGIGRKFQTPTIFSSLTVAENLEAAAGFKDHLLRLYRPLPDAGRLAVEKTLDLIRLSGHLRAGQLAHGEKQWLEIGMLLVQEPKLLLLDEPVAGMTRSDRNRTGELLQAIAQHRSVLVVEHDMDFVRRFATTVTVLHSGKKLCEGPVEIVQNDPKVIEVYLGRGHGEDHSAGRSARNARALDRAALSS